jgi:excisionase family DNA binding protein
LLAAAHDANHSEGPLAEMSKLIRLHHCRTVFGKADCAMIQTGEENPMAPPAPAGKAAFLSRGDVSRLFGVSVSTVTRWARQGLLKTLRTPGGHYRFPAEETRRAAGGGNQIEPESRPAD